MREKYLLLLIALLFSPNLFANIILNSATVNNASSVSVSPSDSITISLSVTTSGLNDEWESTAWLIAGSSGNLECVNTDDRIGSGTYTQTLTVPAPSVNGSYNLYLVAYSNEFCLYGSESNQLILSNAVTVSAPINTTLLLHMDENSWDGTLNEVIDSSGNNYSGNAVNGANTSSTDPALVGDPGSCNFGSFDGVNDYIKVDNLSDQLSGTASLSFWIRTTQTGNDIPWLAPVITGVEQVGWVDDIFWGWLDSSGHIGIARGEDYYSKSTIAINDGIFHHVVLTRNANTGAFAIYIDGNLNRSGFTGSGIVGPSYSDIGRINNYTGAYTYFEGDLDELQIFDSELSLSEVQSLMAETHACPEAGAPPSPCSAIYNASEYNTVFSDDFSSDLSAWQNNKLSSIFSCDWSVVDRQLRELSHYCRAFLEHDLTNESIDTNTSTDYIISVDITPNAGWTSNTAVGVVFGYQDDDNYYLVKWDSYSEFHHHYSTYKDFSLIKVQNGSETIITQHDNIDLPSTFTLTIIVDAVNGTKVVVDCNSNTYMLSAPNEKPAIKLFGLYSNYNGSGVFYDNVEVLTKRPPPEIDHFELSYSNNGLTCQASPVTFKACANEACSALYDIDFDITLSPESGWASNPVTVSSGIAELQLQHLTAETVSLSIATSSVSPTNELKCFANDVFDPNCEISFAEAGFVFDVPTMTACKPETDVIIKAVKMSGTSTQCIGALTGTQSVNFWSTYINPINGSSTPIVSGSTIANSTPGTAINLDFDINGEASFTAQYDDAGKLELNAVYTHPDGLVLSGSDEFVAKPAAIAVYNTDSNASCTSEDASCTKFKKAGEHFDLTVKAACWQEDGDVDFSDNPATPNFTLNSIPITHSLVAPTGGVTGLLLIDSFNFTASNEGIHTVSQAVSEVGVFNFNTNPPSYFDESLTTSESASIGRFYPDHFEVTTKSNGNFVNSCGSFTYSGQDFYYGTAPTLSVMAYNSFEPATVTENYTGDFVKLTTIDFSVAAPSSDATQLGADHSTKLALLWTPDIASLSDNEDGSVTFTFGNDSYRYKHETNSVIGEFSNAIDLIFTTITDNDGVNANNVPYTIQPSGASIRFGRLEISNSHGSELTPLSVNITAEYFNGFNWVKNTADQCTSLNLATNIQLSSLQTASGAWQAGTTTMIIGDGSTTASMTNNAPLLMGEAQLSLSAPGEDNKGFVDIQSLLSASKSWLLGDYDGDGSFDDEATARASFGLFKGNDHIIFRRELY